MTSALEDHRAKPDSAVSAGPEDQTEPAPPNPSGRPILGPRQRVHAAAVRTARRCAYVVVAIGVAALTGWTLGLERLTMIVPGEIPIKPNSALCFVLLALALLGRLDGSRGRPWVASALAAGAGVIALLTGFEILTGRSLGIDDLLVHGAAEPSSANRMPPAVTVSVALLAGALLLLDATGRALRRLAPSLAMVGGGVAYAAVLAHAADVSLGAALPGVTEVALPTAIALVLVGAGTAVARPDRPPTRGLLGDTAGGTVVRWSLPIVLLMPLVLEALGSAAADAALLDPHLADFVFDILVMVVLIALVVRLAHIVDRGDLRRRAAERRSEETERRYASLVEGAIDGVVSADRDGTVTYANEAALAMFACEEAEIVGQNLVELTPERYHDTYRVGLERYAATGEGGVVGQTVEVEGRRRDGSEFPLELSLSSWSEGEAIGFTAIIRDRSESVAQREALERSEQLHRELVQSLPDTVVILLDADGRYLLVEGGGLAAAGYENESLEGQLVSDVLPEHAASRLTELTARVRSGERVSVEWPAARTERLFMVDAVPFPDGSGRTGLLMVSRDITANKRFESELAAARDAALDASRAKSAFLANMSHEIRTPMNGVIGMTELLLETDLDSEQREYARTASSSAESLLTVIDDILDFSKIEAGRLELETVGFSAEETVDEVCELMGRRAQAKGLELLAMPRGAAPGAIRGDEGRLRQVLTNLVSNAVKFTDEGEVTVSIEQVARTDEEVTLRFEVSDTGIGIDPERMRSMFDPFAQADVSTTRRYGGTGLGLTICRQLVELMGGQIDAESQPGRGSTFRFTVTCEAAAAQPFAGPTELAGKRALVVDDNATNRLALEQRLDRWAMTCASAANASEALDLLLPSRGSGDRPDVIILDHHMPGVDGLELARQIQAHSRLRDTPIVLLTSSGDQAIAAREAGIAGYTTKPVRQGRLRDLLTAAVRDRPGSKPPTAPRPGSGPAADAEAIADPEPAAAPTAQPSAVTDACVLVVEDNPTNQTLAVKWLERQGYATAVAFDGEDALEVMAARSFAAVLMDCQMPRLDGYAATAEIRRREGAERHTPIIAMTANAMKGDRERCLEAGMDDYLAKPLRPDALAEVLGRWTLAAAGAGAG